MQTNALLFVIHETLLITSCLFAFMVAFWAGLSW